MTGRRPADGSFPACPSSGICRAESIRTHGPCRNCALSNISLKTFLANIGSNNELLDKIRQTCPKCVDLLQRLIDGRDQPGTQPGNIDVSDIVLDIYAQFGDGNIARMYLTNQGVAAPRPADQAHARMILEALGLTCYLFNPESVKCQYIEDLIYCKRHTPVLTLRALDKLFVKHTKFAKRLIHGPDTQHDQMKKRKHAELSRGIAQIKTAVLKHEKSIAQPKDIALRKQFNRWLKKLSAI